MMERNPDLNSPRKLAARATWPADSGGERAGKNVSERMVRYVLEPGRAPRDKKIPSISLDFITALASAFGEPVWRLLVDDDAARHWVVTKLLGAAAAPDERVAAALGTPPKRTQKALARRVKRRRS
jgi:hypothetical protein